MALGAKTIRQHKALHGKAVHQGVMMEKGRPVIRTKSIATGQKSYLKGLEVQQMRIDKSEKKHVSMKNVKKSVQKHVGYKY